MKHVFTYEKGLFLVQQQSPTFRKTVAILDECQIYLGGGIQFRRKREKIPTAVNKDTHPLVT